MSTMAHGLNPTAKPRCDCGGTCACGGGCNGPDQSATAACEASGCECGCGGGRAAAVARAAIRSARAIAAPHSKAPKTAQTTREETPRQADSLSTQHDSTPLSAFHPDALPPDTIKPINEHWHSAELSLQHVHCASCVGAIERLPRSLPGLVEARVNLRERSARVVWERDQLTIADVAAALDRLGFPPSPKRQSRARDERQRENREQLVRLAVAGAIATNVMLMALALYAGAEGGAWGGKAYEHLFRWLSAALTAVSLAWPGRVFFTSSWRSIRAGGGRLNLDAPIALAMLVGGVAGLINTLRGTGEIYFDSVAALVFLLLIGRWLQGRQQRWAIDAVEMLLTLTPRIARRVETDPAEGGREVIREVATDRLAPMDLVEVRAGEAIPADGEITIGRSHVDESILTGESRPIAVEPGRSVAAGSTNLESVIRVRVRVAGQETRVAKLMAMLADAAERKAPTIRWADTLSGYFITGMLALSLVTLIVWLRIDPARAVENAASLLIVTCPCALGLAMPLVMTLAIGRAAHRQILIKGADALEALATPATLLLDKTGTLTQNALRVLRWTGDTSLQPLVARIEANSTHPIARAIVDAHGTGATKHIEIKQVSQTTGSGIEALAVLAGTDRRVFIGSRAFATQRGVTIPRAIDQALDQAAHDGATPVVVAIDDSALAAIALGDPPREDAASAIASLRDRGWNVGVLSGDDPRVVHSLATRLSIPTDDAHGGISPEAKLAAVENRLRIGPVVMVGDGVNDAAALAAASVGIAVHGGSEASLTAADIYLARPGLWPIVELLDAARATRRAMRRCMLASVAYNAVSGTLAICGLISPLIAALLMPASSLTVLAIAVLSRTFPQQPTSPAPALPSQGAR